MLNILERVLANDYFQTLDDEVPNYISEEDIVDTYMFEAVKEFENLTLQDTEFDYVEMISANPVWDGIIADLIICKIKKRRRNEVYDPEGNTIAIPECDMAEDSMLRLFGIPMNNKLVFPSQGGYQRMSVGAVRRNSIR